MILGQRIRSRDTAVFLRLFGTMMSAGLPLVNSLNVLRKQIQNKRMQAVIADITKSVESGRSLAYALRRHPAVFPDLAAHMVAAGETGGVLDAILERLSRFLERADRARRKAQSALLHPLLILSVTVPAVAALMVLVVPTFEEMFASAGVALPTPTRVVVAASDFFADYWWVAALLAVCAVAGLRETMKTAKGREFVDGVLLRLPLAGPLIRKTAVARFSRTLATLIDSGVPILNGMDATGKAAGNLVIQNAARRARDAIAGGDTIARALKASGVFPLLMVQMTDAGERSGSLAEMLTRVADLYDEESDVAAQALLSALEPALIAFLGLVVGGIVVALYLPIFDMVQAVG